MEFQILLIKSIKEEEIMRILLVLSILSRLNERYEAWIQSYDKSNLLVIEVDDIDFVKNPDLTSNIITETY